MNRKEKIAAENVKNAKAFVDYSQTIDNTYLNVEDYKELKCVNSVL